MNTYLRTWSFLFGIGLGILWIVGLSTPNSTPWLTWLDGAGAVFAFIISAGVRDNISRNATASPPLALSLYLFALWAIGLATTGVAWQDWWTFGFACAFLLMGIAGLNRPTAGRVTGTSSDVDRFKRSA